MHPATANLYLEIPDIKAVIDAYEQAPFAKFFRDEDVRAFIAKLTPQEAKGVSFASLLDMTVNELRDELPPIAGRIIDLVPDVEHLSLSVSGIELAGLTEEILAAEDAWTPELQERLGKVRLQAVMDFSSAEAAQRAVELIRGQIGQDESSEVSSAVTSIRSAFAGAELDWTFLEVAGDDPTPAFWFATKESRLILGAGFVPDAKFLFPRVGPLDRSPDFVSSARCFQAEMGIAVLKSYLRLDGLDELPNLLFLVPDISPEVLHAAEYAVDFMLPGGSIEVSSRTRLIGSRFITESFDRDFSPTDSPRFSSDEPVTRESFSLIPGDAVSVWATHIDKRGIKQLMSDMLAEFSDSAPDELQNTLEAKYGFRPDRDLIDSLGGEFVYYSLPFSGIGMPKAYIALELDDPNAFARGLEGLGKYLTDIGEGAVDFNSRPYRKSPFMSFSPGKGLDELLSGADVSWMPAFLAISVAVGVMEDRALLSLSSMYTKREMKRLLNPSDEDRYVLMDSADEFPSGVTGYGRSDYGAIMAGAYDSVRGVLPLIVQGAGVELPFTLEDMPSSDVFTKYFLPTKNWDRRVEGGEYNYNESSFGPEVGLLIGAVAGAALISFGTASEIVIEADLEPVPEEHGEEGPEARTQERMRELKVGIVVYKGDVGQYPAALSNLLDATPNFPSGVLEGRELPTDAWGNALHYSRAEDGSTFQIWSIGADGVDAGGKGDDLVLTREH